MGGRSTRGIARELRTLWDVGVVDAAEDGELLTWYATRGGEAADAAFRALVRRHGAMVRRVCAQVLGDGPDAQDAAQAVFLILSRKAATIRRRGSIGPWLYGVACRVAWKQRRGAARRRRYEAGAAAAREASAVETVEPAVDWEAVHDEVGRLPEKYRAPVVLFYFEGQSYEETARRLDCPIGTVRVRLSRARDRLRDRLERRGVGPAPLVPFAAGERLAESWIEATVRAARAFAVADAVEAGVVSASTLAVSQGVLRSMMFTKWKIAACALLSVGTLTVGGRALVGQDEPTPAAPAATKPAPPPSDDAAKPKLFKLLLPDERRQRLDALVETARKRLEAQRKFYEEGRITVDRYLDASTQLKDAELRAATTREQRLAAVRANLDRHRAIEARERAELDTGRGTIADVTEVAQRSEAAQFDLFEIEHDGAQIEALERRIADLEQKLERVIKRLDVISGGQLPAR